MPAARTPRRNGPYAPLSAFYAEDDAVIALEQAGNDMAELLFLRALAYCAREPRLDGHVSRVKLSRIFNRPQQKLLKAAQALVEVGLWDPNGDGWRIRQWHKWNRSEAEISQRQADDRSRKVSADSARNGNGSSAESAHQSSAVHDTSEHGSSMSAAAAELQDGLNRVGIVVSWNADDRGMALIEEAIARCGVHALVKNAQAQYRPNDPASSVRAFIPAWALLPAKAQLEVVGDPCPHGEPHWTRCPTCKAAAAAS